MPRLNGKFVSQKAYDAHMAAEAASEENTVTETAVEPEVKERKTRQADPLLAAKRRLEAARKAHAKAEKKKAAIVSVEEEYEAATSELVAATEAFQDAVASV